MHTEDRHEKIRRKYHATNVSTLLRVIVGSESITRNKICEKVHRLRFLKDYHHSCILHLKFASCSRGADMLTRRKYIYCKGKRYETEGRLNEPLCVMNGRVAFRYMREGRSRSEGRKGS